MRVSSPEFEEGGHIPERFGYKRKNVNPELNIQNIPEETVSLVLIMDDPDAKEPAGKVWTHWIVWNMPPTIKKVEEGEVPGQEGYNDYGEKGYGGPNPPDRTHSYFFRLYALDDKLNKNNYNKEELLEEINDKIIEEAKLEGKFDPV